MGKNVEFLWTTQASKKTHNPGNLLRESNLFLASSLIHAAWDWVSSVPRIAHCILIHLVLVPASLERCENEKWLCWKLTRLLWSSQKFSSGFNQRLVVWHRRGYSSSEQDVNTLWKHHCLWEPSGHLLQYSCWLLTDKSCPRVWWGGVVVNMCFVLCFSLEMSALYTRGEGGKAGRFSAWELHFTHPILPHGLPGCSTPKALCNNRGYARAGPFSCRHIPRDPWKGRAPTDAACSPRASPHPTPRCSPLGAFPNNPPPQREAAASAAILGLRPPSEGRAENAGPQPQALPQPPATQRTPLSFHPGLAGSLLGAAPRRARSWSRERWDGGAATAPGGFQGSGRKTCAQVNPEEQEGSGLVGSRQILGDPGPGSCRRATSPELRVFAAPSACAPPDSRWEHRELLAGVSPSARFLVFCLFL